MSRAVSRLNRMAACMLAFFLLLPQVAGSANRKFGRPSYRPGLDSSATVSTIGKIAFASDRDRNFEIYVMDADGGGQTRLTEDAGEDVSPAWAPDGKRLAFVSTRDGNAEIYVMNADGTGQTRLTNNTAADLSPVWSPNGLQIG